MVDFQTLRITDDGSMVIVASVKNQSYYKNVYIDQIIIDSFKTFSETGPSDKPFYTITFEQPVKKVDTTISKYEIAGKDESFKHGPFFVYVHTTGAPAANTPCGMDQEITTGVAIDLCDVYKESLKYLKEVNRTCMVPDAFADFVLRYKALLMAIRFKDWKQVFKIWGLLFNKHPHKSGGCGCHGRG